LAADVRGILAIMKKRAYDSEQAYKKSVKPLALMFIIGGLMMFLNLQKFPDEFWSRFPVPLIHTVLLKKYFFHLIDFLFLFIGIGLLKRWRPAWYTLFVYLALGTLWLTIGIALDYFPNLPPKYLIIPLGLIINGGIGVGIYFATKPAFTEK
jgi:hypothetical protein